MYTQSGGDVHQGVGVERITGLYAFSTNVLANPKQLTVALENRPGRLAHVAKVLADAKVNILAVLGSTAGAQGSVQVVVDNVNKAKKALGGAGLSYTEGTLEQVELANKPGALALVAERLAKKGINIDCAYATVHKSAKKATVVLGTSKAGEPSRT